MPTVSVASSVKVEAESEDCVLQAIERVGLVDVSMDGSRPRNRFVLG